MNGAGLGFYLLVGILSTLLASLSERRSRPVGLILSGALLSFVGGFRAYSVGVDTELYRQGIDYFVSTGQLWWRNSFSYGYGLFVRSIFDVVPSYTAILVVQAVLTNGLILARLWDYRRSCRLGFAAFVYYFTIYPMTLCLSRQLLAVAIVFFGSRWLDDSRIVRYCMVVLLSAMVHVSAVVGLLAVPISVFLGRKPLSVAQAGVRAIVGLASIVGLLVGVRYLSDNYSIYSDRSSEFGLMVPMQFVVLVGTLLFTGYLQIGGPSLKQRKHLQEGSLQLPVVLYCLGLLLSAGSYIVPNAGRLGLYFTPFGAVVYAAVVGHNRRVGGGGLVNLFLGTWIVLYFIYAFFINTALGIVPYMFVWG